MFALPAKKHTVLVVYLFVVSPMDIRLSAKLLLGLAALGAAVMFSSSASAQTCATNSAWEYAFMNQNCQIPSAILDIKSVIATGNYYNNFLMEQSTHTGIIFVPSSSQQAWYHASYTGLVSTLWFSQGKNTPGKLNLALQNLLPQMRARYTDPSLSPEERTKFAYLYFLNANVIERLSEGYVVTPTNNGLTFIQNYTALNGRNYTIWSSDLFFLFARGTSDQVVVERRARSLGDLINYIEYQNRVIHTAPNNRRYGVWKYNTIFKVNRDNGSLLNRDFLSPNAAIQMLETCATNGKVPYAQHSYCGFDTYGRK